jgi:Family of unknown function (DUF6460)
MSFLTLPARRTNSAVIRVEAYGLFKAAFALGRKGSAQMERFFGGNPALVLVRLVILSLIVGVVLAALGFSPFDIIDSLQRLIARIYDMGFAAVEKALRYFLLGAVIVFPVWLVMRVLKVVGRSGSTDVVDASSRKREA